jgi:fibronectin type 3 domain-containing protein
MLLILVMLAVAAAATQAASPRGSKPVNTSPPTISGTAEVGQTLVASPGTWSGTQPITYAYQWRRCDSSGASCVDLTSATEQSYTATASDGGATLRVRVTAKNSSGKTSAVSAPTPVVRAAPAAPSNTSPPTISGTAQEGQTLTADQGSWSGDQPISYAYQWQRCGALMSCSDVMGATATSYMLTSADVGATIIVQVTASNSAGSGTATSAPTAVVEAAPVAPSNTSPPTISGTAQEGRSLTGDPGSWSGTDPISYAYQWRRCDSGGQCTDIAGATGATYTLVSADVGSTLVLLVTATNSGGAASATSAPTAVVEAAPAAPANSSEPTISGVAREGETLTADPGTWSGADPISYAYQWQRCDSSGGSCLDVASATEQSYTATASDVGARLRVTVTASNAAGSASAASAPTDVVTALLAPPANTSEPTITGTAQAGSAVTASPGEWSGAQPIEYGYQWLRCDGDGGSCLDLAGATGSSYSVGTADVGSTLRVRVTATNTAGSGSAQSTYTSAVTASGSVGYRGPSTAGAGIGPTGSKPESKLWWAHGTWWASMWAGSGAGFHIFRLDQATQRWIDTGVQIDPRSGTRADALWDGSHLYVASHVFSTCGCSTASPGNPSRLYRFSYSSATNSYALDPGFPININDTSTETLVIDKDSTGTIWATWAQSSKVMVSHSVAGDDSSWITPYVVPSAGASNLKSDDISALVTFGGNKVGVAWSNQNDAAMYFAFHVDGASDTSWTASPAIRSPLIADDHINLKSLQTDGSGRVFAVTKTSLNDATTPNPSDPIVLLFVRDPATGWSSYPVWRIGDGTITRPILLIDESNFILHVFATSSESGGTIREKTSPISSISFPSGQGSVFLRDASQTNALQNATTTKQNVTRASGLVVLASNDSSAYYWHNSMAIP